MSPLVVYLDTSDYARLYRNDCDRPLLHVKAALQSFVDRGQVVFPVSFFVLFELLQDCSPEFKDDRLERARFLRRICGLSAFPFTDALLRGEGLSNEGAWFPVAATKDFNVESFRARLLTRLRSKPGINRKARLALSNPTNLKALLRQHSDLMDLRQAIRDEDLPLSEEFIEGRWFRRYLLGEARADQANKILRQTLTDPELLFRTWYDFGSKINPIRSMFDADAMAAKLERLVAAVEELRASTAAYSKARRSYTRARAMSNLPESLKVALPPLAPASVDISSGIRGSEKSQAEVDLGEDRSEVLWSYLEAIVAGTKFQRSDLVDLAHATYLPLCDLWRGDRKFSTMLVGRGVPHARKIVPSLLDLPKRIEEELARRDRDDH